MSNEELRKKIIEIGFPTIKHENVDYLEIMTSSGDGFEDHEWIVYCFPILPNDKPVDIFDVEKIKEFDSSTTKRGDNELFYENKFGIFDMGMPERFCLGEEDEIYLLKFKRDLILK